MQPNAEIVNYWLKAQSVETQLLVNNKSVQEIKYLMQVVKSFSEDQCKTILEKLSKNQDSRLKCQ